MQASKSCLDLIKHFESLQLKSYPCPTAKTLPKEKQFYTVGYGHTHGVTEGMTITPQIAEALLLEDVRAVEADLRSILSCEVTQGQWDALVSLCFNLKGGAKAIPVRAPKLWKALHAGDKTAACIQFADINRANGKPLSGLTARRRAEQELFLSV
jgi:lysozyme